MIPYCILVIENDDDRAFMSELYIQYERLIYSEIYKLVPQPWNAEDVMQSTLINLINKISLLRSLTRDKLVNYIITASQNTAKNYLRDNGHPEELPYEDYLDFPDDDNDRHTMELRLLKKEELDSLSRVWPKLDERTRHLLEGYYILGKSMRELGPELGIKPESVRMLLTRARQAAYQLLEKELEAKK